MEAIAQEIQKLHANTDEAGRGKINHELSVLLASFDTDWEKILKLAAGVSQMQVMLSPHPRHFKVWKENKTSNYVRNSTASPVGFGESRRRPRHFPCSE
jgi:hypothetical protein